MYPRLLVSAFFIFSVLAVPPLQVKAIAADEVDVSFGEAVFQRYATERAETAEEVFGGKWGYVHPFISVGAQYTDNLFNTDQGRQGELTTVVSPGIWLALPASREKLLDVTTMNSAPGGLEVSRLPLETGRRHQGYGLYRADIKRFSDHSELDRTDHRAEGLLSYRLRGGLYLEVLDIFTIADEDFGTSTLADLDRYRSNLFSTRLGYDFTPKLGAEVEYSNHALNYQAGRNDFRDRTDNAFSGYIFYRVLPKTALFIAGDYIEVGYDRDSLDDSTERNYYGGVQWLMTARSVGRIKVGWGEKDYVRASTEDQDNAVVEVQVQHWLTPKTSLGLSGWRKTNETTVEGPAGSLSNGGQLVYRQRFTRKFSGEAAFGFVRDSFAGDFIFFDRVGERTDDYYKAHVKFGFAMYPWLNLGLEYAFKERDSNFDVFDYRSNTAFFNVTLGI